MNCRKFEEQIFLYQELTEEEQDLVNAHVASCASCEALLESMRSTNARIQMARGVVHELRDPARLTESIMGEVKRNKLRSWNFPPISFSDFSLRYVRYAMASASLVFIAFLGMEQLTGSVQYSKDTIQPGSRSIVLDRSKFQLGLRNSKKSKSTLLMLGCVSPFRSQEVKEDCLRQKLAVLKAF